MTTLVAIRQSPLQVSMSSNQPDRRTGKRLATVDEFENDDDFVFTRKPKKPRTDEVAAEAPVRRSPRNKAPSAANTETTTIASHTTNPRHGATTSPLRAAERRHREASANANGGGGGGAMRSSRGRKTDTTDKTSSSTSNKNNNNNSSRHKETAEGKRFQSPPPRTASATTIALPTSDTPVIARNKEMRKKAAAAEGSGGSGSGGNSSGSSSNRRSSLGTRGRRASSLMESGQAATPHREVNAREFYKHISAEALLEPMRMKQLLTWCGERALPEKPRQGVPSTSPALGARMILEELLKEFSTRPDFSNWLVRDESVAPVGGRAMKPNPRNIELDKRMASLEARIKRLQEEKSAWQSIQKPTPDQPQLYPPDNTTTIDTDMKVQLPDFDLLDADEGRICKYMATELEPLSSVRARTESRLKAVQKTLEFEVDHFADNVHKLEQRVRVAGKQADMVLRVSAGRLKRREEREKNSAGTREMPMMEVLRSLGSLLPEGGGGGGGGGMG